MHAIHVSVAVMAAGVAASAMAEQVVMVGGQISVARDTEVIAFATGSALAGTSSEFIQGKLPDPATSPLTRTLSTTFGDDLDRFDESASRRIEHRGSTMLGSRVVLEIDDFTIIKDAANGVRIVDNVDMVSLVLFDIFLNNTVYEPSTLDLWGDLDISYDFATRLTDLGSTTDDMNGNVSGDARSHTVVQPVPTPAVGSLAVLAGLGFKRRRR